jgi:hypothetical protein
MWRNSSRVEADVAPIEVRLIGERRSATDTGVDLARAGRRKSFLQAAVLEAEMIVTLCWEGAYRRQHSIDYGTDVSDALARRKPADTYSNIR